MRGQVLYAKNGDQVPVDLTTAPVRDGDQLVGAVMTFADRRPFDSLAEEKEEAGRKHAEELERLAEDHASELTALRQSHVAELEELAERHVEELAANEERYAALGEREKDRYEALAARHDQLLTLLGRSLRGPLDELRRELSALAADDAGQLWPEANQVLHHLSAGYARITTLIDNVLGYQRLDTGGEHVARTKVMLDAVVTAGVDGAVELIGPGRVQFAVHAPPIEAEVDPRLLATALAHLVADVAGVDATGNTPVSAGGYLDNTVVVAAAQRGEVVRIEVRGPYGGGDPVHEPIVRGIVRAHGGVLQTHEVPGMSGSAFVLEVPIGGGAGSVPAAEVAIVATEPAVAEPASGGGRRRARRASVDAFLESEVPGADDGSGTESAPTGRRRRRAAAAADEPAPAPAPAPSGTGRRRGRPAEDAPAAVGAEIELAGAAGVSEGAVVTAAEHAAGAAASNTGLGGTVPPQGMPAPSGLRARSGSDEQHALPPALPAPSGGDAADGMAGAEVAVHVPAQDAGRRRRALAAATERAAAQEAAPRTVFALPPAEADQEQQAGPAAEAAGAAGHAGADEGRHDAVPHDQADEHTPPQPHPTSAPTGRRRRAVAQPAEGAPVVPAQGAVPAAQAANVQAPGAPAPWGAAAPQAVPAVAGTGVPVPAQGDTRTRRVPSRRRGRRSLRRVRGAVARGAGRSTGRGSAVARGAGRAARRGSAVARGAGRAARRGSAVARGAGRSTGCRRTAAGSTGRAARRHRPAAGRRRTAARVPVAPAPQHGMPVAPPAAAVPPQAVPVAPAPQQGAPIAPQGAAVPPQGAAVPPPPRPTPLRAPRCRRRRCPSRPRACPRSRPPRPSPCPRAAASRGGRARRKLSRHAAVARRQ
ncbi:hypothetical protein SHKM778_92540 [Streptomyces sp. KM77-8]|uniref:Histidine kinase/HSP90-like ATPase domain-containing protein n=1 Tax=Streptomyces haneummycinicus TaxID=3074435 RepID=A0AAT9HZI9_9ACTN